MRQQISRPTEEPQKQSTPPLPKREPALPRRSIIALLVFLGLLLLIFSGVAIRNVPRTIQEVASAKATATSGTGIPLQLPGGTSVPNVSIPGGYSVIYEQQNAIYRLPANGGESQQVATPGYIYSRAVPPLVTASGQLLYSGNGLWITGISNGQPQQIATISSDDVITAMVLSRDKTMLAWSTAPKNGNGTIRIYAGPLVSSRVSSLVYQQDAARCPCLRPFSFGAQGPATLLLTDDRGDHEAVAYDLWTLDIARMSPPQPLLKQNTPQVPLTLAPDGNTLIYSSRSGMVPLPTDNSAPDDIAALNYANSLSLSNISKKPLALGDAQVILPAQKELRNSAAYHWAMPPQFSPDGKTLVYIVFSSDEQAPFGRHSALYRVPLSGEGAGRSAGKPQVVATASARYMELGAWLNDHILTFYADSSLYALDIQSGAAATIAPVKAYSRIVAITAS